MYDNVEVINKLDIQIDRLDNEISNFEEISLIKIDVQGVEKLVLSSGLNILKNTDLILAGDFSTNIEFGSSSLAGGDNSAFMTNFDLSNNTFNSSVVIAKEELKNSPNSKYSNISGKLLIGGGDNKSFLNDQAVLLEDNNGNLLKRTITDENGDFSFKNKWSYPEGVDKNKYGQLICDGLCSSETINLRRALLI